MHLQKKGIDLDQPARNAQADLNRVFSSQVNFNVSQVTILSILFRNRRGGLVVRASVSGARGCGFDPRPRQTKVFETGSSVFPPWRSG